MSNRETRYAAITNAAGGVSQQVDGITLLPDVAETVLSFYNKLTPANRERLLNENMKDISQIVEATILAYLTRARK